MAIKDILISEREPEYREFSKKLIPTKYEILGVRIPKLRGIVKRILSGEFGEPIELFYEIPDDSYEEIFLKGGIISGIKNIDISERLRLIERFMPCIDNWSICDTFVSGCKFAAKNKPQVWMFLNKYALSNSEFEIRFAVIMMMCYFLDEEYIDTVLDIAACIKNGAYYVKMAVAWLIATALAKNYKKAVKVIENVKLDSWTHNKAIQKAIESRRITEEQKEYLRSLKV